MLVKNLSIAEHELPQQIEKRSAAGDRQAENINQLKKRC
jgi:hypothetical protein